MEGRSRPAVKIVRWSSWISWRARMTLVGSAIRFNRSWQVFHAYCTVKNGESISRIRTTLKKPQDVFFELIKKLTPKHNIQDFLPWFIRLCADCQTMPQGKPLIRKRVIRSLGRVRMDLNGLEFADRSRNQPSDFVQHDLVIAIDAMTKFINFPVIKVVFDRLSQ